MVLLLIVQLLGTMLYIQILCYNHVRSPRKLLGAPLPKGTMGPPSTDARSMSHPWICGWYINLVYA